jgi:hypothetical protein
MMSRWLYVCRASTPHNVQVPVVTCTCHLSITDICYCCCCCLGVLVLLCKRMQAGRCSYKQSLRQTADCCTSWQCT